MNRQIPHSLRILILLVTFLIPIAGIGKDMISIQYERHEFRMESEPRNAPLSTFVYDVPYFGACGIFPPVHIMNEILLSGGSQGGMSPGATWKPFSIDKEDYDELAKAIKILDPKSIGDSARYTRVKFDFDHSFDNIKNWESWVAMVCKKHRKAYHMRMGNP